MSFSVHCEWGAGAIQAADIFIIVDVLSFSTCVDIAVSQGAIVYPYYYKDERAAAFATKHQAQLAGARSKTRPSLSPASLKKVTTKEKWVIPSPNGSTLTHQVSQTYSEALILCGCLRNPKAIAQYICQTEEGAHIQVIAAGERWPDQSLRPAWEDLCGAGAIIKSLQETLKDPARLSFEAAWAMRAFEASHLSKDLKACESGQELIQKGFPEDVDLACKLNASTAVPILISGAYVNKTTI